MRWGVAQPLEDFFEGERDRPRGILVLSGSPARKNKYELSTFTSPQRSYSTLRMPGVVVLAPAPGLLGSVAVAALTQLLAATLGL